MAWHVVMDRSVVAQIQNYSVTEEVTGWSKPFFHQKSLIIAKESQEKNIKTTEDP